MAGEWFFSTLAQVSAAIVGFIVTITMVTYSLQKQKKMSQVAEFRDLLENFHQSYSLPFDGIQAHLSRSGSNNVDEYVFREYGVENIREEMFTEDYNKHPVPVQFYCLCLHITTTVFHDLRPGKPAVPDRETIESVGEAAMKIQSLLGDEESCRLIYESLSNSERYPEDVMNEPVLQPPVKSKNTSIKSLEDVRILSSEMTSDFLKIRDRFPAVYSDYTTDAYNILNMSVYLIICGVLLPLLILITQPGIIQFRLNTDMVFLSESILLGSSSILTFALLDLIRTAVKSEREDSDESEPRWITQRLVRYLPSIV